MFLLLPNKYFNDKLLFSYNENNLPMISLYVIKMIKKLKCTSFLLALIYIMILYMSQDAIL